MEDKKYFCCVCSGPVDKKELLPFVYLVKHTNFTSCIMFLSNEIRKLKQELNDHQNYGGHNNPYEGN